MPRTGRASAFLLVHDSGVTCQSGSGLAVIPYDGSRPTSGEEAKIGKHACWQVFPHSDASPLKGDGEDVKVVQDSLRHPTFQITMDTYTQAMPAGVRSAHAG